MKIVFRKSNKQIFNNGGLLPFRKTVNQLTSVSSILRRILPKGEFKTDECALAYMSILATGKSDFEAVNSLGKDSIYSATNDGGNCPSEETVRQRMDELAVTEVASATLGDSSLIRNQNWIFDNGKKPNVSAIELVAEMSTEFIKKSKAKISPNKYGYVVVDHDTTTLDNSKTKKEKVEYTYQGFDGYAPIAAYLGEEGWNIGLELRPGSMHGQNGFGSFLTKIIARASYLTPMPLFHRMDSAFDAAENYGILLSNNQGFVVKRNNSRITNRGELIDFARANSLFKTTKKDTLYKKDLTVKSELPIEEQAIFSSDVKLEVGETVYHMRQIYLIKILHTDKNNNRLLFPDREIHAWMTSLPEGQEEAALDLYRQHGTSEQFHSELKTDMDLERLPSGKFATNSLVFSLAALVYNILKFLGSIAESDSVQMKRHSAKRRRIRTIIEEVIQVPIMLCEHARRMVVNFCRYSANIALILNIQRELATLTDS